MENLIILAGLRASHFVLVAVGFALVLGSCRVLNLMHGSYVMLGAYATYAFSILLKQAGVPMVVPLVTKRSSKPPCSSCR
jgi:branched-subunit amino acid ABC-type transport system permease component